VAGDVAADIGGGDAGLAAKCQDDRAVELGVGDSAGSRGEEQVDVLAGLAVQHAGLLRPEVCHVSIALPRIGSTGLVNEVPVLWVGRSSRQTASRASTLVGVSGDREAAVLPADAADAEANDLVAAQAAEQPGQR
jgi:hypothetical protein